MDDGARAEAQVPVAAPLQRQQLRSAIGSPFSQKQPWGQPGLHYVAYKVRRHLKAQVLYHCSKLFVCSVYVGLIEIIAGIQNVLAAGLMLNLLIPGSAFPNKSSKDQQGR